MTNANTMSIEDVLYTIDTKYRLSPYLKLRGHISFKAARLAGMYCAQQAKVIKDAMDQSTCGSDAFALAMGQVRGLTTDDILLNEMGMESDQDSLWNNIKALVLYANKLNFDMQELVDPSGNKRNDPHWKFRGVYFNEAQQRQSWMDSLTLIAEGSKADVEETYAEYAAAIANPDWALTEAEWTAQQVDDNSLYADYKDVIADLIVDIGDDEAEFHDLPVRTQIAAIENMRGKVPSMIESAMKSFKYDRSDKKQKTVDATNLKGLILGFDQLFCEMLDSSRYANFSEYMYNYIPSGAAASPPVSRRMIARREVAEVKTFFEGKRSDEEMSALNSAGFLDELESDLV